MASKLERDFPWLSVSILATDAAASGLARSANVSLACHERAIAYRLITMLCREYRTNAAFAAYLRMSPDRLALGTLQVWLNHAVPAAFEHVTGLNALQSNVCVP